MLLDTKRLILKKYTEDDLDYFFQLRTCEVVWTYSTTKVLKNLSEAEELLKQLVADVEKNNFGFHALFEKETGAYIGEAGILNYNQNADRCVIGYNLLPEYWNLGYAVEISKALIEFAFHDWKVERVEALAMVENVASCKVLEKSGLFKEGILKHFTKINDSFHDVAYYGLIRKDFL